MSAESESFPDFEKLIEAAPEFRAPLAVVQPSGDLIPITCESGKASVDARDLHSFLGVGKQFGTWITDRIEQFGFTEGHDFEKSKNLSFPKSGSTKARPQTLIEYTLSMDMAKELSMVERTEKGKQARQYFIACEKRMLEGQQSFHLPTTMEEVLVIALANEREKKKVEAQLAIAAPKAEALDLIAGAEGLMNITTAAKTLQIQPKRLFAFLDTNGWTYRHAGRSERLPYQSKISAGLMTMKAYRYTNAKTGEEQLVESSLITPKGLARLAELLTSAVA